VVTRRAPRAERVLFVVLDGYRLNSVGRRASVFTNGGDRGGILGTVEIVRNSLERARTAGPRTVSPRQDVRSPAL